MTTHQLIKQAENDSLFLKLLQKGLIPLSVLDRKCYYEKYIEELKLVPKKQAIANASEDYHVSERTIIRAIKMMEG